MEAALPLGVGGGGCSGRNGWMSGRMMNGRMLFGVFYPGAVFLNRSLLFSCRLFVHVRVSHYELLIRVLCVSSNLFFLAPVFFSSSSIPCSNFRVSLLLRLFLLFALCTSFTVLVSVFSFPLTPARPARCLSPPCFPLHTGLKKSPGTNWSPCLALSLRKLPSSISN